MSTRVEGGDEHLCVLRFENPRTLSSCCGDSTRVSSDPGSFESIAVGCGSLVSRKRIGRSAARRSAVAAATRPSRAGSSHWPDARTAPHHQPLRGTPGAVFVCPGTPAGTFALQKGTRGPTHPAGIDQDRGGSGVVAGRFPPDVSPPTKWDGSNGRRMARRSGRCPLPGEGTCGRVSIPGFRGSRPTSPNSRRRGSLSPHVTGVPGRSRPCPRIGIMLLAAVHRP